jgi:type I restriction-modification system DNA methylase subunit
MDPACGSGAFPIGFMQLIVKILERLSTVYDSKLDEYRPAKISEKFDAYTVKLSILKNSLYGVDIEPMAIEISKLRAWLSLVIDGKKSMEPLPNLEFNFVCANSLIPLPQEYQQTIFDDNSFDKKLDTLIENYFETHGIKGKQKLREEFNSLYYDLSSNNSLGSRSNLLKTWNPFKFDSAAEFFDSKTMMRVDKFDIVIGNPPYIHFQKNQFVSKLYQKYSDNRYYKTYEKNGDIYTLFFELAIINLKDNGVTSFITSNKWLRTEYGSVLRDYLLNHSNPEILIDLGEGIFDNAVIDTCITIIKKNKLI